MQTNKPRSGTERKSNEPMSDTEFTTDDGLDVSDDEQFSPDLDRKSVV